MITADTTHPGNPRPNPGAPPPVPLPPPGPQPVPRPGRWHTAAYGVALLLVLVVLPGLVERAS